MEKPKIRFKGYQEDWEQRKLGDFGKATGGTSIESEFSEDGIYKVISIGSYSENGVYNDQGIRAIKSDKTSNRVLNRNDLTMILNDKTTSGNIIGRVLLIEESGIYVYNQRTERIEINLDEYDPVFLYEMLNAPNIREKIIKQAQGNTQIYVNWIAISLLEYMIPSKEEQVKIGEYLHSISNLITLHQRKCEEMKTLKKYMLQKMFPQNGQSVPQIRFSGFTEDWEQRKLGELGSLKNGMNFSKEAMGVGYPFVNLQNIFGNNVIDVSDLGKAMASDSQLKDYNLINGDVLFVRSSVKLEGVGEAALVPQTLENTTYSGFIIRFRDEYGLDNNFKRFVFGIDSVRNQIMSQATNSANKNISQSVLENLELAIPSKSEQQKIGAYFSNLDYLITLHQQKCDELRNIKKFMLQNMFI